MKKIWTADGPIDFDGKFHQLRGTEIVPAIYQKPYPKFYLGGGSPEAAEVSVKHSDVHLFWGDQPAKIAENITHIRALADKYGRAEAIGFGMRLQIICRETEAEAWAAADELPARQRPLSAVFATSHRIRRRTAGYRNWQIRVT